MKFNAAILNPPYSVGKNKKLGWQIVSKVNADYIAAILPLGTVSNVSRDTLSTMGLYKATRVDEYFDIQLDQVYAYVFNKTKQTTTEQVMNIVLTHNRTVPADNLSAIYFSGKNKKTIKRDVLLTLDESKGTKVFLSGTHQIQTEDTQILSQYVGNHDDSYRVVLSEVGAIGKLSKMSVAEPTALITPYAKYFKVPSLEAAQQLIGYLNDAEVTAILQDVKLSAWNSEKFIQYIPTPDFLK